MFKIATYEVEDVGDYVKAVDCYTVHWAKTAKQNNRSRGHREACWTLIPTILRNANSTHGRENDMSQCFRLHVQAYGEVQDGTLSIGRWT